jgi:hypothetical protein
MADYRAAARRAAQRAGLDPDIFERQIGAESGFNPRARSPKGATGIAQIMPATAKSWGVDPNDPIASLNAAAKHMAQDVRKYGGYENALRAYNAGPAAIERSKSYAETNAYVKKILRGRSPSVSGGGGGAGGGTTGGGTTDGGGRSLRTVTQTTTTPGVNNSVARAALIQSFLRNRGNPLSFAQQAIGLKDVAPTTSSTSVTGPVGPPGSGGGGGAAPSAGGTFAQAHSPLLELIYNTGTGKGYAVKDGAKVSGPDYYRGVWAGHRDHVHVAAGPKTIVELGRLAQKMGLRVGENPHFGGVSPVHVSGSYHYKGEAIDVSGDPGKMNRYARAVERVYGIK